MADPISNKGFGDAALAERVIEVYTENGDILGLGRELSDLGVPRDLAEKLERTLIAESCCLFSPFRYGIVDDREATDLEKAAFSREFVKALRGDDGAKALRNRVRRLADRAETKWWRWGAKAYFLRYESLSGLKDLSSDGKELVAGDILPTLVRLLQEDPDPHTSPSISELAAKAIASLGPAAAEAVEAVITAAQNGKLDLANALSVLAEINSRPDIAIPYVLYVHKTFGADEEVGFAVRATLEAFEDRAIPWLLEEMEDPNSPNKALCEGAFGFLFSSWEGKDEATRNLLRKAAPRLAPKYLELHRAAPGYNYGEILAQFGPYSAKLLVRQLPPNPPNAEVDPFQQKIINTLANMGGPAVPELVKVLRGWRLQNFATKALFLWPLYVLTHMGNRGDPAQAIPELLLWLKSPYLSNRNAALVTLNKMGMGSPEVVSALISSLGDRQDFQTKEILPEFANIHSGLGLSNFYLQQFRKINIMALGKLAPKQPNAHLALPLLAGIRDDPAEGEKIRVLARDAIQKIESEVL